MLDNGLKYEKEIRNFYNETRYDEKYKYYYSSIYNNLFKFPEDVSKDRYFVSMKDGKVIGFISYSILPDIGAAYNFGAINFGGSKMVFGRDLMQVVDDIFCKFNMNKLEFFVVRGNPIETSYDRIVKKLNGKIIGTRRQSVRLMDNKLYDDKSYEIMRYEYLRYKDGQNKRRNN